MNHRIPTADDRVLAQAGRGVCLAIIILGTSSIVAPFAIAEPHSIRDRGRTLVEAEDFSAVSEQFPYPEVSQRCSGQKCLGYYWGNTWFELELDVPQMLNYRMSLRVASPTGSKIQVQLVDAVGKPTITTLDVPKTGSFKKYTDTQTFTISLPAGVQTLRFTNLVDGANIDYITFSAGAQEDVVLAQPVPTAGPMTNPMKGFSSGWWRDDDEASVGFQCIEWGSFEPEDDVFDWDYVEEVMNRPGTKGRHVILQFVVDWDNRERVDENYLGPKWLLEKVGEVTGLADPSDPNSRQVRATRYNDPVFIDEANEAIKTLLERYRDDPRLFVAQVGLLGFWGDWLTFPRNDWNPTRFTKFAILDAYMKNLGSDGLTQVRYPDDPVTTPRPRMGYSNGSATLTDHGYEFGELIAERELWKNGPVGGEWPPNIEPELWERFFQTDEGEFFIKQARYSTLLPPQPKEIAEKIPGWSKDDLFMKMNRQMGYNFQAKAVRHLVSVDSARTYIEVDLQNAGIAPFYKNWDMQLAVLNDKTGEVIGQIEIDADLRKWGPGESVMVSGAIAAQLDPLAGYQIGLRIVQPQAGDGKTNAWPLNARNVYIVLANKIDVIPGQWDESYALQGGWNILDDLQCRQPVQDPAINGRFFPFEGSFRPLGD